MSRVGLYRTDIEEVSDLEGKVHNLPHEPFPSDKERGNRLWCTESVERGERIDGRTRTGLLRVLRRTGDTPPGRRLRCACMAALPTYTSRLPPVSELNDDPEDEGKRNWLSYP